MLDKGQSGNVDSEEVVRKRIGEIIYKRRLGLGLSQEKLAERAHCHRNTIGIAERGEKSVSVYNLYLLAAALETTAAEILDEACL